MAEEIQLTRLVVSLEARLNQYDKALAKARADTNRQFTSMRRDIAGFEGAVSKMERGITGSFATVGRAFGVLGIAMSGKAIMDMTSAWTDLNSRVENAAGGMERGAAVMDALSVMARRTYSSLEQTAEGYLNNSQALTALGYSTQQQLDLVEALNNSLVISATRGQAAQSVMDAWAKGMANGSLRGQNLNAVIQSGGRLAKALADSMGINVNELRQWGEQGKITTDVMFGVTKELETLRDEAAAMPATVTDGFTLLRDAVWKFVGEADKAVGSSSALAEAIVSIADAIDKAPDSNAFDKFFSGLGDGLAEFLEEGAREIEFISKVVDALSQKDPADVFVKLNEAMGGAVRTAEEYELALTDAEQALVNLAVNSAGRFADVDAAAQDLFQQILEGRGTVEKAREAIEELAKVNPAFADLKGGILSVIEHLFAMRDAANAARDAAANITTDLGYMPTMRQMNRIFGPDLSDDGAPGGPITPPSRPSGGRSAGDRYADSISNFERRIETLKQETALISSLNPLLNDYGYAKEKLKAIQELETAAARAGIEIGPQQREQIENLATAYAAASAEAQRLAEAQKATVAQFGEIRDAARSALETIIDGFIEGKDAGEIFSNVLKQIGSQFLQSGLNALFGGGATGGFGLFGGLFGFAEGGKVRGAGTGTSDSIPALLSNGEFVVKASSAAKHAALLEAINEDRLSNAGSVAKFADGGRVGAFGSLGVPTGETGEEEIWRLAA